jgi:hypothetical protein
MNRTVVPPYVAGTAIHLDAQTKGKLTMSAAKPSRDDRRHRLATNDNETVVEDELDTEGHRLATNDNETTVPSPRRNATTDDEDEDDATGPLGMRRPR